MSENDVIAEYVKERYPWILDTIDFAAYKFKMKWKAMVNEIEESVRIHGDRLKDIAKGLGDIEEVEGNEK